MYIRRFTFTLLTLLIFVFALYDQGMIFAVKDVSRETTTDDLPHAIHTGISQDGAIHVGVVVSAPTISVNNKVSNHSRTMRAFRSVSSAEYREEAIYIESVLTRETFLISGAFTLSLNNKELFWATDTVLLFYILRDGADVGVAYDVATHEITWIATPQPNTTPASPSSDSEISPS